MDRAQDAEGMHGKSFLPMLRGETREYRSYIVMGYHSSPHICARDKHYSFIQRPVEWGKCEIYDLVQDPEEKRNVTSDLVDVARGLKAKIPPWFGISQEKVRTIQMQLRMEIADTSVK